MTAKFFCNFKYIIRKRKKNLFLFAIFLLFKNNMYNHSNLNEKNAHKIHEKR